MLHNQRNCQTIVEFEILQRLSGALQQASAAKMQDSYPTSFRRDPPFGLRICVWQQQSADQFAFLFAIYPTGFFGNLEAS